MDISSLGGFNRDKLIDAIGGGDMEAKIRQAQQAGPQTKKEKDLMKASQDMESFFLYMLLKEMRKTVNESPLFHGGRSEEIFRDMMDEELSKKMSSSQGQGIGIAKMLYEQLSRPVIADEITQGAQAGPEAGAAGVKPADAEK